MRKPTKQELRYLNEDLECRLINKFLILIPIVGILYLILRRGS